MAFLKFTKSLFYCINMCIIIYGLRGQTIWTIKNMKIVIKVLQMY